MPHKSTGSGIYCIRNVLNDKVYIGQALRLERRLYEHKYYLERGRDNAIALQRAANKYGLDNFDFFILEYCSPEELNDREIFYIQKYNSNNKNCGYNIASGGNSGLIGYKHSKEFGEKVSQGKKGWVMGQEQREFISKLHKGRKRSEETRRRISIANTKENHPMWGRHHSPETIQKYKETRSGENAYQFGIKSEGSTSKFFGVNRIISKGKYVYWVAYVKVGGTKTYIGSSKIEEDAARMHDEYVKENGLPNPLNFPDL